MHNLKLLIERVIKEVVNDQKNISNIEEFENYIKNEFQGNKEELLALFNEIKQEIVDDKYKIWNDLLEEYGWYSDLTVNSKDLNHSKLFWIGFACSNKKDAAYAAFFNCSIPVENKTYKLSMDTFSKTEPSTEDEDGVNSFNKWKMWVENKVKEIYKKETTKEQLV